MGILLEASLPYRPRELVPAIDRALRSMPVVVVAGMLEVGKTTLLRNAPSLAGRRYVSLDDPATLAAAREDPARILGAAGAVTIDEVQAAPALLPAIKAATDRDRTPGRFLLAWSAAPPKARDTLGGRAAWLELWPMTRREVLGATADEPFVVSLLGTGEFGVDLAGAPVTDGDVRAGGMPAVVIGGADARTWFGQYERTCIEREVYSLARLPDASRLRTLLRLAAARTGSLLDVSEVARVARSPVATVARHVRLLEAAMLVRRLQPFLGSRASRQVRSGRAYAGDSGLAADLSPPPIPGAVDPLADALLETFVAHNLGGILSAWAPEARLCSWAVHGRHAADFVVELGGRVVAIRVRRGDRWSDADLAGLRAFARTTPACVAAIVACGCDGVVELGDRLYAVPVGRLIA